MLTIKKRFFNLKIQEKLFLIFGIFIFLVASLVSFSVSKMNDIEKSYILLAKEPKQRLAYLSDAVKDFADIRRSVLSAGYTVEDTAIGYSFYNRYLKAANLFTQHLDNFNTNLMDDSYALDAKRKTAQSKDVTEIKSLFKDHRLLVEYGREATLANDPKQVDKLVLLGMPLGEQIEAKLNALRELVSETVEERSRKLEDDTRKAKDAVITFSLLILVLALLVTLYMPLIIRKPIAKMQIAMREISKGNLMFPIRSYVKDELGDLSNSIADMVDNIAVLNKHVAILNNIEHMIYVTDLEYNIIFLNQSVTDFYKADKNASIGMKCYEALYRADAQCEFCPLPKLLPYKESLPTCEWEESVKSKDMWLACRTSIIKWLDGNFVQICIGRNNTAKKQQDQNQAIYAENMRKAAEAAREASRAKSVFLATMSHEIRTPMNSIIGFSELALDDNISQKTRDYLEKIKESSGGLLSLINDILDISKIEAGKVSLENIPFDIHEVLKTCQTVISPKALEKGITLFCYTEPSVYGRLMGDPTRIRQALLNLLSNAVKFTHTGIVKFITSISKADEDRVTMHFEVKDSGIGISPEQIKQLFEPFTQADSSMTRKYGGTGLGLPITKSLIELMGGKLEVESAQGVGTKFGFDLEFKIVDMRDTEPMQLNEEIHLLEKPMFRGEVLVCEDNVMNQQVISDHLSRVGLTTVIAGDGKEGVDCVKRRMAEGKPPFDLIFMDVHMPVMDGLEAARKLTVIGNNTPIVALTANIMPPDRDIYKQVGMSTCLAKPYTAHDLWGCLLKLLTPVGINAISASEHMLAEEKTRKQLRKNFWEDNQTTLENIAAAIKAGDIKLAHRIAHTLKSAAGLIGKNTLMDAARAVEQTLRSDNPDVEAEQMDRLGTELGAVMDELRLTVDTSKEASGRIKEAEPDFDRDAAIKLARQLEPMLKIGDSDCMNLIDGLRVIPETESVIDKMEHYDFVAAHKLLVGIRQRMEDTNNV